MDHITVWICSGGSVPEPELHIQCAGCVFDEIDLNRIDRIQCIISSALFAFIIPADKCRNNKCVIVQHQQPHRLFDQFRSGHHFIRAVNDVLNVPLYRNRIVSLLPDMQRVQLFQFIHDALDRLLNYIRSIDIRAILTEKRKKSVHTRRELRLCRSFSK